MRLLLDTNIIIHREASFVINQDIGQLFNWIDKLSFDKCVHPITVKELEKHIDPRTVESIKIKLSSYNILRTQAPLHDDVQNLMNENDITENDTNDSIIINELYCERVDILITEDKNLHIKGDRLGISDKVFTIEQFLEISIKNNPELIDYEVLSVKKEYFGNIDANDNFFDTLREDYDGFDKWFKTKSDETAYVCYYDNAISAFLYIKTEGPMEVYSDINPLFPPKKRLKIGTLKVSLSGLRLGERFLKIIFDNALKQGVDEIYVTIFDNRPGQIALINLLTRFGFRNWGVKNSNGYKEKVLVRDFTRIANKDNPKETFPFVPRDSTIYFVSIYPKYHTELFPDSMLRTESPQDFIENQPHRNSIRKVYISHAYKRDLKKGDVLLFYRTGGYYKGVVTTVAIVDSVVDNIQNQDELIKVCHKKTVLNNKELKEFWNYYPNLKPFVVNLLYSYSLPKRVNLKRLVDLGVIKDPTIMPRGFAPISWDDFEKVLLNSRSDESTISN